MSTWRMSAPERKRAPPLTKSTNLTIASPHPTNTKTPPTLSETEEEEAKPRATRRAAYGLGSRTSLLDYLLEYFRQYFVDYLFYYRVCFSISGSSTFLRRGGSHLLSRGHPPGHRAAARAAIIRLLDHRAASLPTTG